MSRAPVRIQLRRTKGWRKPQDAVVVSRPSRWSNPYVVHAPEILILPETGEDWYCPDNGAQAQAVELFREAVRFDSKYGSWYLDVPGMEARHLPLDELRGCDLACWCGLSDPCHGDVLLEVANR